MLAHGASGPETTDPLLPVNKEISPRLKKEEVK